MVTSDPIQDKTHYMRWSDVNRLINGMKTPRNRLILLLLAHTGRRVEEVRQLRVGDIDFGRRSIIWNIKKKKDKNYRKDLPIDNYSLDKLRTYMIDNHIIERKDRLVFESPYKKGFPLTRERIFQLMYKAAKELGIRTVGGNLPRLHDFRHSCAIHILEETKDIRHVKGMLHHSDLKTTATYLEVANIDLKDMIEQVFNKKEKD